jgi:hypothetical protein
MPHAGIQGRDDHRAEKRRRNREELRFFVSRRDLFRFTWQRRVAVRSITGRRGAHDHVFTPGTCAPRGRAVTSTQWFV